MAKEKAIPHIMNMVIDLYQAPDFVQKMKRATQDEKQGQHITTELT